MLLAIAITAPLISGCVGWRDEVAMAQSTANQALATAQSAQSAAGAAQQRADQAQQTAQLAQSSAQAATSVAAAAQASSAAAQASASAAQQAANQATATVAAAAIERAQFAQARGPRVDRACLHKATWLAVAQTGEPRDAGLSQSLGRCRRDKKWDAFVQSGLGNAVAMSNPIFLGRLRSRG
jgi:hypothetical protein